MTKTMVERVARAIAKDNGDDFDAIPKDKQDWTANHSATGRFRDVNEPRQDDYLSMSRAAIEAMREPTEAMIDAAREGPDTDWGPAPMYARMIDAALSEKQG